MKLGTWKQSDLQITATQFGGVGADDKLDPLDRLARSVIRLAHRRLTHHQNEIRRDTISVFLLKPEGLPGQKLQRQPMLDDGGIETAGQIWFVNEAIKSGRQLPCPSEDDGETFDYLEGLGLGEIPAVIFNPAGTSPTVRVYPKGVNADTNCEKIEINLSLVTAQEVLTLIDEISDKKLCTPDAMIGPSRIWEKPESHWATSHAEVVVQDHLMTALMIRLPNCNVRQEQAMKVGRVDIEIVPVGGTPLAEIEIKVLRERNRRGKSWSQSKIDKWIEKGMRQAVAYRDERGAQEAILCCFDMRAKDLGNSATFAEHTPFAQTNNIILQRNHLYNSSEAYRVAKYPAKAGE